MRNVRYAFFINALRLILGSLGKNNTQQTGDARPEVRQYRRGDFSGLVVDSSIIAFSIHRGHQSNVELVGIPSGRF